MKKAMISQPMNGLTDKQIITDRDRAVEKLSKMGYEVINTFFADDWYSDDNMKKRGVEQIPVCYLAKSLENMSLCHAVYFVDGWEDARGCKIEREVAERYGIEIIEEEEYREDLNMDYKYVKKPVVIEAFQYDGDLIGSNGEYYAPDWAIELFEKGDLFYGAIDPWNLYLKNVVNQEDDEKCAGSTEVKVGNWIIEIQGSLPSKYLVLEDAEFHELFIKEK